MDSTFGTRSTAALAVAAETHVTQRRKGADMPYFSHMHTVAALVLEEGGDKEAAFATVLHDNVNDQTGDRRKPGTRHRQERRGADRRQTESCCRCWRANAR